MPVSRRLAPLLSLSLSFLAGALAGCAAANEGRSMADPARIEGPAPLDGVEATAVTTLTATAGWQAALVHESDSGIWDTGTLKCFPQYGFPEVFALDDKGRCTILVGYSGTYSTNLALQDREWLGALEPVALELPAGEPEFYTGGKRGILYQCRAHADGSFDTRVIARFPGEELHMLVSGDLDPAAPGAELLAFTHPGHVYAVRAPAVPGEPFRTPRIATLAGRVRQTLLLPAERGAAPRIAAAARSGEVLLLGLAGDTLETRVLADEPSGFGRLALAPGSRAGHSILYATRDDGLVLRFEEGADGTWARELVYAGPQGPRGIAAGRFVADPAVESVAVFGYSGRVELLTRRGQEPWRVETLFEDRDKGHWLAAVELDGRNATDELLCSGYGKRVVLLAREPGYGLGTVPGDPAAKSAPQDGLRVAVLARPEALATLSPLSYRGGFEPKTFVYETLVRRDANGAIAPALASAWRVEDGGRTWFFEPRADARWHDGSPVDTEALRVHVERWAGLPESSWLGAARRIERVSTTARGELRIDLTEPYFLLGDLCAVNPAAVLAPAAIDGEGRFVRPLGSGPFRVAEAQAEPGTLRLERCSGVGPSLSLRCFDSRAPRAPLEALLADELDVLADGWYRLVPRAAVAELVADPRFELRRAPGSLVRYLAFGRSPARSLEVRRAVAHAVDRDELVERVELGYAAPCRTLFAPWISGEAHESKPVTATRVAQGTRLRLVADAQLDGDLARTLGRQLERAGLAVELSLLSAQELANVLKAGDFDLRFGQSYGVPYDPDITLSALLHGPREPGGEGSALVSDPDLDALIDAAAATIEPLERRTALARIERRVDEAALLVPLFVPERLAIVRRDSPAPILDHDLYRLTFPDVAL